jgi:hypothetical protein
MAGAVFFRPARQKKALARDARSGRNWLNLQNTIDIDISNLSPYCPQSTPFGLIAERFSGMEFFLQKLAVIICLSSKLR